MFSTYFPRSSLGFPVPPTDMRGVRLTWGFLIDPIDLNGSISLCLRPVTVGSLSRVYLLSHSMISCYPSAHQLPWTGQVEESGWTERFKIKMFNKEGYGVG